MIMDILENVISKYLKYFKYFDITFSRMSMNHVNILTGNAYCMDIVPIFEGKQTKL